MTLYHDELMDHYRHPRNNGCKDKPWSHMSHLHNPSCGDKIVVKARIVGETVKELCFEGYGCALSTAAASLLTEHLTGKTKKQIAATTLDDVKKLLNVSITPARTKCALLPLQAIQEAALAQ